MYIAFFHMNDNITIRTKTYEMAKMTSSCIVISTLGEAVCAKEKLNVNIFVLCQQILSHIQKQPNDK